MYKSFIYTWKRIAVVLFGELFLVWGIVLLFAFGFSYAKEDVKQNNK